MFGLAYFSYGMALTLSTIMPEVLTSVFDISDAEIGVLGGIFNLGFTIGTFGAAFEDILGRRWFVRIGIAFMFAGTMLSSAMPEFWSYCVCRMMIGIGVGLYEIALVSFVTELNSIPYRAKYFVSLNSMYYVGAIVLICLSFALMPDLEPGYWRVLVAISGIVSLPPLIFSFTKLIESPRFLIAK
jgi:putative MFS transporter